jgi:threonine synthase
MKTMNVSVQNRNDDSLLPKIRYSVPTGNFGDILAGFYAKQMGLPIHKLIIATNENDILHRFLQTGTYNKKADEPVRMTLSPAMDILISSNFERLLFHLLLMSGESLSESIQSLREYMSALKSKGGFTVSSAVWTLSKSMFLSYRCSDSETSDAIRRYFHVSPKGYVLDPHTAVGVVAAENVVDEKDHVITIVLGTASPGKFPEAVLKAVNFEKECLKYVDFAPKALVDLEGLPTRCIQVATGNIFVKGVEGVRKTITGIIEGKQM